MPAETGQVENQEGAALSETVYAHLRAIAQRKLSEESPGHTLQATALVHEAYMRLDKSGHRASELGSRFYWAAAEAMRRILIEHARGKKAAKRGGNVRRVDWTETVGGVADLAQTPNPEEFEALDQAILRLQEHDARAGDVVRLRFFAGMTLDEIAPALGISPRSAKRDWEYARAWLLRELASRPGAS
jgi:RNA polymerase sigma factor (TIGR02999 family)